MPAQGRHNYFPSPLLHFPFIKNSKMKRTSFCLCLFLAFFSSHSQTDSLRKDTIDLLPVEVRALRASALAPFTKTNLTSTDIQKQNLGQDLPFILNQTPSVVINSDAGNGIGYTGLRIRGTDLTRINVTLNGIPYNDPESQGVFFVDLPDFASSVNSMQIQRGVGTSSNGAGAFGATINFSTNEINTKPYASLLNSIGSFNTHRHTIKAGTGLLNNHFTVDARLSKINSAGFIDRASSDLQSYYLSGAWLGEKTSVRMNIFSGQEKTFQAWSGIPEFKLFYNEDSLFTHYNNNIGSYYFTKEDSMNLFTSDPRKYNVYTYPNQTDNYKQDHYQLFFNHSLKKNIALSVAFFLTHGEGYYEEYKYNQKYSSYNIPDYVAGNSIIKRTDLVRQLHLNNDLYGGIFSLQYKNNLIDYTLGGSWNRFDGHHYGKITWATQGIGQDYEWYRYPSLKEDANVYGKFGYKLGDGLYALADLQYRYVRHNINGTRKFPGLRVSENFNFFNPKFGLTYSLKKIKLYASYAMGNKEPNRTDFETGTALQVPKPERLHDFEAGIESKGSEKSYGATMYYMLYKNQLVLTGKINDVGDGVRINVPHSYRLGFETWGNVQLNERLGIQGNITVSNNKIKNYADYIPKYNSDFDFIGYDTLRLKTSDISFSPRVTAFAGINIKPAKNFEISINNKAVSKQYLDNTRSESKKLKGYFVQDAQLRYTIHKKFIRLAELVLQVNNLLNRKYEANGYTFSYFYDSLLIRENFYYPMGGTNLLLAFNLQL
jgi:iron complex outermembrane receptor protein